MFDFRSKAIVGLVFFSSWILATTLVMIGMGLCIGALYQSIEAPLGQYAATWGIATLCLLVGIGGALLLLRPLAQHSGH